MKRRLKKIEDEEWKRIPYADKHYEVSNYGRIKSFCYDKVNGRIVKPGVIKGFLNVSFLSEGKRSDLF
ncbi:MAG: NUMOD4 domain-containing protein [Salinivirgaceae bacterium]